MNLMTFTNILLLALLAFTALLVWSRNWKRKQAYLAKIKRNPENLEWLGKNLSGEERKDLKTISGHFGLPLLQSKQLLDYYRNNKAG